MTLLRSSRLPKSASVGLLLCLAIAWLGEAANAAPRTNVLLITSEDNGPELGCYGDPYVRTPNLDKLASEGARFERAFVPTASCSESRAALLTGLYPHLNGQIGLATHHYRMYGPTANAASLFKAAGFRTGLIGKLHVNPDSAFPFDYRPSQSMVNTFSHRDVGKVAEQAAEFISAGEEPFFLMVNYADAHLPFLRQQHGLPEKPLAADDVKPLPWVGLDTPQLRAAQANYYNCMMRLDTGIGLLMAALDKSGKREQTLVIYMGDHGAQFPRGKLASYESSLRVPLLVRWPGHVDQQVRSELVTTLDLLPTMLSAAGEDVPAELSGMSLLPLITRGAATSDGQAWRKYLFTEYHSHFPPIFFPQRTVRDDRYKLIANLMQDRQNPVAEICSWNDTVPYESYVRKADVLAARTEVQQVYATWRDAPPVELYDLQEDPYEWRNLADDPDSAGVQQRLLAELAQWRASTRDPLLNPEKLRKLAAEHDALPKPYQKPSTPHWGYPDYLRPGEPSSQN